MINNCDSIGLLSFIHKFKNTSDIEKAEVVKVISQTPDDNFYILDTNKGCYFIYEVDYISSFEYHRNNIFSEFGKDIEILEVKESTKRKGIIKKYITRDKISQNYYYLFLVRIV